MLAAWIREVELAEVVEVEAKCIEVDELEVDDEVVDCEFVQKEDLTHRPRRPCIRRDVAGRYTLDATGDCVHGKQLFLYIFRLQMPK
jgi:hypothetical protein